MTSPEESPFLKRMKRRTGDGATQRPRVHARDAAGTYLSLQRELMLLETRLRAIRQLKRLIWAVSGIILMATGLALSSFWVTQWLREIGWPIGRIAAISLLVFGGVSSGFFTIALRHRRR